MPVSIAAPVPFSPLPHALSRAAVAVKSACPDKVTLGSSEGNRLTELWRDYGVNPVAMTRRAFVTPPVAPGAPLSGGVKAPEAIMTGLRGLLEKAVDDSDGLATLEVNLKAVAESYGVRLNLETGAPLVNWDAGEPAVLDVRHTGGPSAMHEMVHVVQCIIGGAAALSRAASADFKARHGREPRTLEELSPFLGKLDSQRKAEAMKAVVKPMESQAYARFEETAFHTAGFFGRKSKDLHAYKDRLKGVIGAFVTAYSNAAGPDLSTARDAKVYGAVGHIARTHGETALLLGGAMAGYYGLTRLAMRVHPALSIPLAAPLGYLLYRSLVSG